MARKIPKTHAQTEANPKTLVVFGTDEHGKPHAARFTGATMAVVAKAAQAMQLELAEVIAEVQAEVAQKLPTGRLYSSGKGFVPPVRRELFAKLLTAFGIETGDGAAGRAAANYVYPANHDEIAPGNLVLMQAEKLEWGWWEAIVLERNADMVTARWRDYPKAPKFVRHLDAVALIRPPVPPKQAVRDQTSTDR